jgi:predicted metal-dependent phosphoesterase TrpH
MAVDLAESLAFPDRQPGLSVQSFARPQSHPDPQDAVGLRLVFEAITAESCPRFFNFHLHTVCSDGRLSPQALIQQATEVGLKGLAITDHHSVKGYKQAQQWLAQQQKPVPQLWIGTEISAALLNDEVHILAYAFDPDEPDLQAYLQGESVQGDLYQAQQVIGAIHQAGGLAVLAHPARYRRSLHELIPAAAELGIDGVETYYAYSGNPSPWRPSPKETAEVEALASYHQLLNTCGTDTHGLNLLQRL